MNSIFHGKLDEFMIIYINDILVYSTMMEEHVDHLEYVLSRFHKKFFFCQQREKRVCLRRDGFPTTYFVIGRGEVQP
jgi:hypothetical protein